jgi:hypothetical protein
MRNSKNCLADFGKRGEIRTTLICHKMTCCCSSAALEKASCDHDNVNLTSRKRRLATNSFASGTDASVWSLDRSLVSPTLTLALIATVGNCPRARGTVARAWAFSLPTVPYWNWMRRLAKIEIALGSTWTNLQRSVQHCRIKGL